MPWVNEEYFYTVGILKAIAQQYKVIASVLMIGNYQIVNRYAIALFKADFDNESTYSIATVYSATRIGLCANYLG